MSNNRNITQLPVNSNLSTIEGFAAVDISGANVQISGQSIIDSIDAVTSVLSSNTALLTVTGGNVPTITVNTAPIAKGGTGLATADQIVTYVATQTGGTVQPLIIEGTYSEIKALKDAGELIIGTRYLITDFKTRYTINKDGADIETFEGPIEPLIVTANSTSKFSNNATSTLHPKDEIQYTFDTFDVLAYLITEEGFPETTAKEIINNPPNFLEKIDTLPLSLLILPEISLKL